MSRAAVGGAAVSAVGGAALGGSLAGSPKGVLVKQSVEFGTTSAECDAKTVTMAIAEVSV